MGVEGGVGGSGGDSDSGLEPSPLGEMEVVVLAEGMLVMVEMVMGSLVVVMLVEVMVLTVVGGGGGGSGVG